jgi:nickel superoxide dismutase
MTLFLIALSLILLPTKGLTHCEIPCGIYDDMLRVKLIYEHVSTIEKSMKTIEDLAKQAPVNYNQLVRWITNKETHATEIQQIVSQYFLTQRIKPDTKDYTKQLTVLHKIMVHTMKCKQTTDLEHVRIIRSLLRDFESLYFVHPEKH